MTDQLIHRFYEAFQRKEYRSMAGCYHENLTFGDPVFGVLDYKQTNAMWHMLCERGKDLQLDYGDVRGDDHSGSCRWEARYTFSSTGKKVHNIITANFRFEDDKIIWHRDQFSFWRWSGQALGLPGAVLGWSSFLRNKVRRQAMKSLEKFISTHIDYQ